MRETWKPVVGHERYYEVSDRGRVRSLDREVHRATGKSFVLPGRHLSLTTRRVDGHVQVTFKVNRRVVTRKVHSLVLEAFVSPRPEGLEACHNDGDPANNRLNNLRWDTRSENTKDRVRHGRHHMVNREACPRGHRLAPPNLRRNSAREGHRGCLACSRTRSRCTWHGEPFDVQMADEYYEGIMREGAGFQLPRKRKEICDHGHAREAPNLTANGTACLACTRTYHHCRYRGIPFDPAVADQKYGEIMKGTRP